MEREQTKAIIKDIKTVYGNKFLIENPKDTVDAWHVFLKDYEYNNIVNNLKNYITHNKFAPTISDLINPPKNEGDRYVPSVEETRAILEEQERVKQEVKNNPDILEAKRRAQEEIRRILGIRG